MGENYSRKIKKLKRERAAIDKAIADFERLQARSPMHGRTIKKRSKNLIMLKPRNL
jgi:hypothetical protein